MRRLRLALFLVAFAAWTVALVLASVDHGGDAAIVAVVVAIGASLAAFGVGLVHALVTLARHWRAEGLPIWRDRR